jgi:hypothetical protein
MVSDPRGIRISVAFRLTASPNPHTQKTDFKGGIAPSSFNRRILMAKDGTNRGGPRPGSGRKPKPLSDRIQEGSAGDGMVLPEPVDFQGSDMPPVKDFLRETQKNGKGLCAEEIFRETWNWLRAKGCEKLVSPSLIEQYAMSVSRWIQCEECISEYGFLAKHPTTGAAIASPYVSMAQNFMKQTNQNWYQIQQIVKDNCSSGYGGANPQDDLMERLLTARKGR